MISACIITKNEEINLKRCLESIKSFVDEIILVDTGSVDNTLEVAKQFNCNVLNYTWDDNFSNARNFSMNYAKEKFIFIIDCDEVLINGEELLNRCKSLDSNIGGLIVNVISESSKKSHLNSPQIRLFRNTQGIKFCGAIHEQVIDSILNLNFEILQTDIIIYHFGYKIPKSELLNKMERNLRLIDLELNYNQTAYYLLHKARTLIALGRLDHSEQILMKLVKQKISDVDKVECFNILADIKIKNKNFVEAIAFLKQSLSIDSQQYKVYLQISNIYFFENSLRDALLNINIAESILEKIDKINDYNSNIFINLAFKKIKLLLLLKDYDKALQYINIKHYYNSIDPDILFLYSNALFKTGNYSKSLEILKLIVNNSSKITKINNIISKIEDSLNLKEPSLPLISLCMIVRNEEKYIEGCLKCVNDLADEIIIVDTGSVDNTIQLARKFTDKIYHFKWIDDFSAARNESLRYAQSKWILYLDADERLSIPEPIDFRNFLEQLSPDIGAVNCIIESETKLPSDSIQIQQGLYPRIFRNFGYPSIKFEGKIHEQISNSLNDLNKTIINSDIKIVHLGYGESTDKNEFKLRRNLEILLDCYNENPNESNTLFHLGQSYLRLKNYELAKYYFDQALSCKDLIPSLKTTIFNVLGQLAGMNHDYQLALHYAQKSLSIIPKQIFALAIKSEALNMLKMYDETLITLSELLGLVRQSDYVVETAIDIKISEVQILKLIRRITNLKGNLK